jgi:hypothetical protein
MVEIQKNTKIASNALRITLFAMLITSVIVLSGCSLSGVTGNLISGQDKCINGALIQKVMKGNTINMCCFSSADENKEIEICNSFDLLYSETTIFEDSMMTQRKVSYPQGKMICTDTYGKLPGTDDMVLIEDLSTCEE